MSKIKVKKIEKRQIKSCSDCRWNVEGLCVLRGRSAGVVCKDYEEGELSNEELTGMFFFINRLLESVKERRETIREAMLKRFKVGTWKSGRFIVTVKEYTRTNYDWDRIKSDIDLSNYIKYYKTVKTLTVKEIDSL